MHLPVDIRRIRLNDLDGRSTFVFLSLLWLAALAIRAAVLLSTFETGGDGPARAVWAYAWSQSPDVIPYHIWLPGWVYLTGAVNFIVSDPVNAGRMLSVLLGSVTVPFLYLLTRKVFDQTSAAIAAALLVFLPIHVTHSATTFAEVPLVFGVIAGMAFAILAAQVSAGKSVWCLIAAIFTCTVATSTRYEAWLLVPMLPAYFYWRTHKPVASTAFFLALMAFPAYWMASSYLVSGQLLSAYSVAIDPPVAPQSLFHSLTMVLRGAAHAMASPLFIAALGGLALTLAAAVRKSLNPERWLYLSLTGCIGLFTIKFGLDRGTWMFSRYYVFIVVLLLPFSAIVFVRYLGDRTQTVAIAVAVAVLSFGIHLRSVSTDYNVTGDDPVEFKRLAAWLDDSSCRDDAVLMTSLRGKAWYLQLYDRDIRFAGTFPHVSPQYMIVDYWVSDDELRDFMESHRPGFLVTSDRERSRESLERIEEEYGAKLTDDDLVHTEEYLKVYRLGRCRNGPLRAGGAGT